MRARRKNESSEQKEKRLAKQRSYRKVRKLIKPIEVSSANLKPGPANICLDNVKK